MGLAFSDVKDVESFRKLVDDAEAMLRAKCEYLQKMYDHGMLDEERLFCHG